MTSTVPDTSRAVDPLEDYLALCKKICDREIERLYSSGRPASGFEALLLDYPRRGGKALRPALSIAVCLGLGGDIS